MFSLKSKRAYLDWASAAPVCLEAKHAFILALGTYGNPSSPHEEGAKAKDMLEEARTSIARLCAVKPPSVIFTSGATEANALALQGRVNALIAKDVRTSDMHVLYLPTMHSSVVKTVAALCERGIQTEAIPLADGQIDIPALTALLRPETVLVSVDAVCGETGTRFDTRAVRTAIDARGLAGKALLHVDASQLPLVESIERTRLGADLMTLDAQKVGGVRGIGALIVADTSHVAPIIQGGGQEQGLRPGTEPVALAASFAAALTAAARTREAFAERSQRMRAQLIKELSNSVSYMRLNSSKHSAPHILSISFPGLDTDYAVMILDAAGFAAATKSACETDSEDGSTVVLALTGDSARAASTLRISWGPSTRPSELARFARELIRTVKFLEEGRL
ncbi:MAG: aminotransferase class V-fold PLP-dependent enzyme [Patescibacteria group bacterium]